MSVCLCIAAYTLYAPFESLLTHYMHLLRAAYTLCTFLEGCLYTIQHLEIQYAMLTVCTLRRECSCLQQSGRTQTCTYRHTDPSWHHLKQSRHITALQTLATQLLQMLMTQVTPLLQTPCTLLLHTHSKTVITHTSKQCNIHASQYCHRRILQICYTHTHSSHCCYTHALHCLYRHVTLVLQVSQGWLVGCCVT